MLLDRLRHKIRTFVAPFAAYHLLFMIVITAWALILKAAAWIIGGPLNPDVDWALMNACALALTVHMAMMVMEVLFPRQQEAPLFKRPFGWAYRRLRLGLHVAIGVVVLALAASMLRDSHYLVSGVLILYFVVQWTGRGDLRVFYRM